MNKLILQSNEPTIDNILKLINHIKSIEYQNGLSDEEIIQKYTNHDCRCLVSMVQQIIPIKVYSIYAPPQHTIGTIHRTKLDADLAET